MNELIKPIVPVAVSAFIMDVEWNNPESIPHVALDMADRYWIAVNAGDGKVYVCMAYYRNSRDTDKGWVWYVSEPEFGDYYNPIAFNEYYTLLGWAEYTPPEFTGVVA